MGTWKKCHPMPVRTVKRKRKSYWMVVVVEGCRIQRIWWKRRLERKTWRGWREKVGLILTVSSQWLPGKMVFLSLSSSAVSFVALPHSPCFSSTLSQIVAETDLCGSGSWLLFSNQTWAWAFKFIEIQPIRFGFLQVYLTNLITSSTLISPLA